MLGGLRSTPPPGYPSLGIGATRRPRYPKAWPIPIARISPATPSTPCSTTPSSANPSSPSSGKSRTAATDTACPASPPPPHGHYPGSSRRAGHPRPSRPLARCPSPRPRPTRPRRHPVARPSTLSLPLAAPAVTPGAAPPRPPPPVPDHAPAAAKHYSRSARRIALAPLPLALVELASGVRWMARQCRVSRSGWPGKSDPAPGSRGRTGLCPAYGRLIRQVFAHEGTTGDLHGQYDAFRKILIADLSVESPHVGGLPGRDLRMRGSLPRVLRSRELRLLGAGCPDARDE